MTDSYNHAAFTRRFYYVKPSSRSRPPARRWDRSSPFPANIDLVVQFNEAVDPYAINTSDFEVSQGTVASAVPLTPQAVDLTITGVTQDGSLTLTVPAGVLIDQYGVPNLAFTGTYVIDIVSEPYPTPLAQASPRRAA